MKKIIGKDIYYSQKNNAQVILGELYYKSKKFIACGPTSFVDGIHSCGWPMNIFTPGEQPDDSILMIFLNPNHLERFKQKRNLNYKEWAPNEIPQLYEVVGEILYKRKDVCKFEGKLNFEIIKNNIDKGICMQIAFPGHFCIIKGYDEEKGIIIYNDPYRQALMEMSKEKIFSWRIDIYPYK